MGVRVDTGLSCWMCQRHESSGSLWKVPFRVGSDFSAMVSREIAGHPLHLRSQAIA